MASKPPTPGSQAAAAPLGGADDVKDGGEDRITVSIRVRPLNDREKRSGDTTSAWTWNSNSVTQLIGDQKHHRAYAAMSDSTGEGLSFAYDHVFGPEVTNREVYDTVCQELVHHAIQGFNVATFAYGQTSTGKTFTMHGSKTEPGMIPQSLSDVFRFIRETPEREFLLRMSYMEIYNEAVNDLLSPGNINLGVYDHPKHGVVVSGLKEVVVNSEEAVHAQITIGEAQRAVASTDFNDVSSRSHTVFRLIIESQPREAAAAANGGKLSMTRRGTTAGSRVSVLNLVDLAGSENARLAGTTGARRKEGGFINKSLLTLGTVISKLSAASLSGVKPSHVPYRDSKLTRILQSALSGNARVAVVCTITPAEQCVEESVNTLKFAARAKTVKHTAIVNEVEDTEVLLQQYKMEIAELKEKVARYETANTQEVQAVLKHIDYLRHAILNSSITPAVNHRPHSLRHSAAAAAPAPAGRPVSPVNAVAAAAQHGAPLAMSDSPAAVHGKPLAGRALFGHSRRRAASSDDVLRRPHGLADEDDEAPSTPALDAVQEKGEDGEDADMADGLHPIAEDTLFNGGATPNGRSSIGSYLPPGSTGSSATGGSLTPGPPHTLTRRRSSGQQLTHSDPRRRSVDRERAEFLHNLSILNRTSTERWASKLDGAGSPLADGMDTEGAIQAGLTTPKDVPPDDAARDVLLRLDDIRKVLTKFTTLGSAADEVADTYSKGMDSNIPPPTGSSLFMPATNAPPPTPVFAHSATTSDLETLALKEQIASLQGTVQSLQLQLSVKSAEATYLADHLRAQESSLTEAGTLLSQLESKCKVLTDENAALRGRVRELEGVVSANHVLKLGLSNMRQLLAHKDLIIEGLRKDLAECDHTF